MPKRSSKGEKRPTDANRLAKSIVDEATSENKIEEPVTDTPEDLAKNPAAVALGRLGGKKGGVARAKSLTPEQRSAIAQKAAKARWNRAK